MCKLKDGNAVVDFEDEVVRGATVTKDGQITYPPPAPKLSAQPVKKEAPKEELIEITESDHHRLMGPLIFVIIGGLLLLGLGSVAPLHLWLILQSLY